MPENNELAVVLRLVADQFKSELQSSRGAIGQFNDFLKDWRTQLSAAGAALFAVAKSTADFGEEMLKGAQKAGTTVQSFSALAHAAKMADVEQQTLINGMKALSVNMAEAARGNKDSVDLFARLGVSAVDATGKLRPIEAVMLDLADVFASSADGAGKNEAAVKLFSKAWEGFLPFLNQGREAIQAQEAEAAKLGRTLSEQDAKAADEFNLELKKLEAAMKGLVTNAGRPLLVSLTDIVRLMKEIASGPVGGSVQSTFAVMGEHLLGLTQAAKEFAVVWKFAFGGGKDSLSWEQLKGELAKIEKEWTLRLFKLQHPLAAPLLEGAVENKSRTVPLSADGSVKSGATSSTGKPFDQAKWATEKVALWTGQWNEQHAKDLIEIWLTGNRALEIQKKLIGEELDLMFRQEQIADEVRKARDGEERDLVARGIADADRMLAAQAEAEERERGGMVALAQAWMDYDNQVMASTEERYTHRMDLLRATLTKETQLTQDEAGRLIIAWQNQDAQLSQDILKRTQLTGIERETLERQYLTRLAAVHQEFSGSVFDGWRRGMEQYVRNTDSAFGFAAQMAQRTAQFMEQNFRTFFFDVMDGNIKSLNDLFKSFANFAKQMIAQVMAQLATMMAMKALTGAFSGGFGLGGLFGGGGGGLSMGGGADAGGLLGGLKFASGGPVLGAGNSDTVRAMLTPGEGVLNRRGMEALAQLNSGAVLSSASPSVNVHFHGVVAGEQPQVNVRRQFEGMVIDVFLKHRNELLPRYAG